MGEDVLDGDIIASAEKFVCRKYKTSEESLDLARVVLLGKVSSLENLPPNCDAFTQHLKRCHYQTAVWRQAHIQKRSASEPREDRLDASKRSTGPYFYDTRSNPKSLSGDGFMPMHYWLRKSSLCMQKVACSMDWAVWMHQDRR